MAATSKTDAQFLAQFEPDLFWQKHGNKVIGAVVAIMVIGAIIVYSQKQKEERQEEAATRLAMTADSSALLQMAQQYKGTELGAQALLRLAASQLQAGQTPAAAESYKQFVATYPNNPLVDSAQLGQAMATEAEGNFEAAKVLYSQISARPSSYAAVQAKIGSARCSEALGHPKEARELYEELFPAVRGTASELEVAIRLAVLERSKERAPAGQPASATNLQGTPLQLPQLVPAPNK